MLFRSLTLWKICLERSGESLGSLYGAAKSKDVQGALQSGEMDTMKIGFKHLSEIGRCCSTNHAFTILANQKTHLKIPLPNPTRAIRVALRSSTHHRQAYIEYI